jgi:predicted nucleic acid-binding protein
MSKIFIDTNILVYAVDSHVSDVNYFSRVTTIKIPGYHYLRR